MSFDRSPALEAQPTDTRREEDPEYREYIWRVWRYDDFSADLTGDDPEFSRYAADLSVKLFTLVGESSCALIAE